MGLNWCLASSQQLRLYHGKLAKKQVIHAEKKTACVTRDRNPGQPILCSLRSVRRREDWCSCCSSIIRSVTKYPHSSRFALQTWNFACPKKKKKKKFRAFLFGFMNGSFVLLGFFYFFGLTIILSGFLIKKKWKVFFLKFCLSFLEMLHFISKGENLTSFTFLYWRVLGYGTYFRSHS